jgi:16S rRNA (adenine1518-N6/adenine1519-N6)-dimethyltransferase
MSLPEIKSLIRQHGIFPNKLLGQNFMVVPSEFEKLARYASLNSNDVVLEVGSGLGFLTRFLANKCKTVISVEKDKQLIEILHAQLCDFANITLMEGDILKVSVPEFNKVVSIPPYHISSRLMIWLFERNFEDAALILQKEFANRLVAKIGTEDYGWLTVLSYFNSQVDVLDEIPKQMFYPQPEVDSVIVHLKKRKLNWSEKKSPVLFRQMLRFLFTERNRKLGTALTPFAKHTLKLSTEDVGRKISNIPFRDKRVRTLVPEDFGVLADAIFS